MRISPWQATIAKPTVHYGLDKADIYNTNDLAYPAGQTLETMHKASGVLEKENDLRIRIQPQPRLALPTPLVHFKFPKYMRYIFLRN
jgi:hypothetical protein